MAKLYENQFLIATNTYSVLKFYLHWLLMVTQNNCRLQESYQQPLTRQDSLLVYKHATFKDCKLNPLSLRDFQQM